MSMNEMNEFSDLDPYLIQQSPPSYFNINGTGSSLGNGSVSPIGDLSIDNLDCDDLPPANPFDKQRTGRIVPVTNTEDFVNLTDGDDDDEVDEDKTKAKQAERFSIFKESSKPQLVNRMYSRSNQSIQSTISHNLIGIHSSQPNSPKSDNDPDEDDDLPFPSNNSNNSNNSNKSSNNNRAFAVNNTKNQPPPLKQEESTPSMQMDNDNSYIGTYHMQITEAISDPPAPAFGINNNSSTNTTKRKSKSSSSRPEKPIGIDTATLTASTSSNKFIVNGNNNNNNRISSKLGSVANSLPIQISYTTQNSTKSLPHLTSHSNGTSSTLTRNPSPGFTLMGIAMQPTQSQLPGGKLVSIPEKSDNLGTAKLTNMSSTSLRKDTSAFDVVNLEDMNTK